MKWTAKFDNGEWVFYSGETILFRSDTMEETTAYQIVSAINASEALIEVVSDLHKASVNYQDYDAALSPEKVQAIAKKANAAIRLTTPSLKRAIVING